jgi:two-component system chemotaxis response regulator CheY
MRGGAKRIMGLHYASRSLQASRRMTLRESLRVLIVDDRAVSRALVSQALDEIGILHHTTEGDGRTALGMLAARPVHLVIADLGMPGMNGLELLHALR